MQKCRPAHKSIIFYEQSKSALQRTLHNSAYQKIFCRVHHPPTPALTAYLTHTKHHVEKGELITCSHRTPLESSPMLPPLPHAIPHQLRRPSLVILLSLVQPRFAFFLVPWDMSTYRFPWYWMRWRMGLRWEIWNGGEVYLVRKTCSTCYSFLLGIEYWQQQQPWKEGAAAQMDRIGSATRVASFGVRAQGLAFIACT
jgi:hypothetical protein